MTTPADHSPVKKSAANTSALPTRFYIDVLAAAGRAYADSAYPALGISRETVAASPVLRAALALRRKVQAARNKREAAQCGRVWIEANGGAQ